MVMLQLEAYDYIIDILPLPFLLLKSLFKHI